MCVYISDLLLLRFDVDKIEKPLDTRFVSTGELDILLPFRRLPGGKCVVIFFVSQKNGCRRVTRRYRARVTHLSRDRRIWNGSGARVSRRPPRREKLAIVRRRRAQ